VISAAAAGRAEVAAARAATLRTAAVFFIYIGIVSKSGG
jgi:hypothetical protein